MIIKFASTTQYVVSRIAEISKKILIQKNKFTFSSSSKLQNKKINQLLSASHMIPHPQKVQKGGEDACFCSNQLVCLADGVGSWAQFGVDPSLYSKELVQNIQNNFKSKTTEFLTDPQKLISESYSITKSQGSTTCCVLTIDEQKPILYSSYIGDTGYAIFRKVDKKMEHVYISEEQIKSFNFPYQIGSEGDNPLDAWIFEHDIMHNDIIVAGTDGVFDNVDENQILNCIKPFWEFNDNIADVHLLAEIIAKYAHKLSIDPLYNSPFSKKAKENYFNHRGGKSDDITVVVAQVKLLGLNAQQNE